MPPTAPPCCSYLVRRKAYKVGVLIGFVLYYKVGFVLYYKVGFVLYYKVGCVLYYKVSKEGHLFAVFSTQSVPCNLPAAFPSLG